MCTHASLSHLSMVRTVFSASRGATRTLKGSPPAVETASGESSLSFMHCVVRTACTCDCKTIIWQVSCHFDNSIIRTIDGKILHKYKHPAAVFGCDWSQNNKWETLVVFLNWFHFQWRPTRDVDATRNALRHRTFHQSPDNKPSFLWHTQLNSMHHLAWRGWA